jgi:hypothetical protein
MTVNLGRLLGSILLLVSVTPVGRAAATNSNTGFWRQIIAEKSLPQIAQTMSETKEHAWPQAPTAYGIQNLPAAEREAALESSRLVVSLHDKIKKDFAGSEKLADLANTYTIIAATLQKAGGYNNLLLADAIRRLVIFRISESIAASGKEITSAQAIVDRLRIPHVDVRAQFELLAGEDRSLDERRAAIDKISPSDSVFVALQTLGFDPASLATAAQNFRHLVAEPSIPVLTIRMAGTELLGTVGVKGLAAFLQKGGKYEELNPADVRAFQTRMGGAENTFQCPALNVRHLRVGDILSLLDLSRVPARRKAFLENELD